MWVVPGRRKSNKHCLCFPLCNEFTIGMHSLGFCTYIQVLGNAISLSDDSCQLPSVFWVSFVTCKELVDYFLVHFVHVLEFCDTCLRSFSRETFLGDNTMLLLESIIDFSFPFSWGRYKLKLVFLRDGFYFLFQ